MLRKVEAGPRIFKGGSCQKSGSFHHIGKAGLGGWKVHRKACLTDLGLCFYATFARLPQGRIAPCERLSVMKTTRFLAGWGWFS